MRRQFLAAALLFGLFSACGGAPEEIYDAYIAADEFYAAEEEIPEIIEDAEEYTVEEILYANPEPIFASEPLP
ncbi:MAG: hypothetical protein LBE55_02705, partial [Clostridiales bacterium]|nr:hypothetical protein [Clostridiales bacterium]